MQQPAGLKTADQLVDEATTPVLTADEHIRREAREVLQGHLRSRAYWSAGRQLKQLAMQTVREYSGRAVFELIQNGYDAHPADCTDGQLAVYLDEGEGDHGVLYVANAGRPFTSSNFEAICALGLSDKQPGQFVGYKGLGFKSVLQLSDRPEVYSADPTGVPGNLNGYRFTFAAPADVVDLLDGDTTTAELVVDELPLSALPVPLPEVPVSAAWLAEQGHVTVVRLPLRSEQAREQAHRQVDDLWHEKAPVLLFLPRLARLTLHYRDRGHERPGTREETRTIEGTASVDDLVFERVDLGEEAGEFLLVTRAAEPDRIREAIEAGIRDGQLDASWLEVCAARPSVSVAVPLSHDTAAYHTYAFLPLGDKAPAPFAGHLNAPFQPNLSRTDLNAREHLNSFLLDLAAETCLLAAELLREQETHEWDNAAVDLVSWTDQQWERLASACERLFGHELTDHPLVPVVPTTLHPDRWASPTAAYRWPGGKALTGKLACDTTDAALLRAGLGEARETRLVNFLDALGVSLRPPRSLLAGWVETMIQTLPRQPADLELWQRAYDDLATWFQQDPGALRARTLLLDEHGGLHPCNGGGAGHGPEVFFAPSDHPDGGARVPAALQPHIVFLHPELWVESRTASYLQPLGLRFLAAHDLVHRFNLASLLEAVQRVCETDQPAETHQELLRFVFSLEQAAPAHDSDLVRLGLHVATVNGDWIPALEAVFSEAWAETWGAQLAVVLQYDHDDADLAALGRRLLAASDQLIGAVGTVSTWRAFLRRIGVRDGLHPIPVAPPATLPGRQLGQATMAVLPLPDDLQEQLREVGWGARPQHPDLDYTPEHDSYRLPGQAVITLLPAAARHAYALLLLHGLQTWPVRYYSTPWRTGDGARHDSVTASTPVWTFLRTEPWLPVHHPDGSESFCAPREWACWYVDERREGGLPTFSPLLAPAARARISPDGTALRRLRELLIGVWDDPKHAGWLLWHHGYLLAGDGIDDAHLGPFHRSYQATWARLAATPPETLSPPEGACLVVEQGGQFRAMPIQAWAESTAAELAAPVYVGLPDASISSQLIRGLGLPLLTLRTEAEVETAVALLNRLRPGGAASVARLTVTVFVDGVPLDPTAGTVGLVDDLLPWLPTLVGLVVEHRGRTTQVSDRTFQEVIDRLRRVRVRWASSIQVVLAGQLAPLPERLRGVFPVPVDPDPVLVVQGDQTDLGWPTLRALAGPLAELIGIPSLVDSLWRAVSELEHTSAALHEELTDQQLATALSVGADQVRHARHRTGADINPIRRRLYPLVAHLVGAPAARPLEADARITDDAALRAAVRALPLPDAITADALVDAATEEPSLDQLRRRLGVDFAAFNQTLANLSHYRPITHPDNHVAALRAFIAEHHTDLINRLRASRLAEFDQFQPQSDWTALRRFEGLDPDPTWLTQYETPPQPLLAERAEQWLAIHGAQARPATPLPALDQVQQTNRDLVRGYADQFGLLVGAWARQHPTATLPDLWQATDLSRWLTSALDEVGALDFTPLDRPRLLRWCVTLGLWPPDMAATCELDALALTSEQIRSQQRRRQQQRRRDDKARNTIQLDGRPIDVSTGSYTELRSVLDATVHAEPQVLAGSTELARLAALPTAKHTNSDPPAVRDSYTSRAGAGDHQLSLAQREAIGFAGEWLAYQWLRRHYPSASPASWVSSYRTQVFSGDPGDDTLGYDLEVPTPDGALYFEVKASLGDPNEFNLTETELRAAQRHLDRWRLIVVTQMRIPDSCTITVLPNPLSPRGQGHYQLVSRTLRFRYQLEPSPSSRRS
jgi:hypothetical protein